MDIQDFINRTDLNSLNKVELDFIFRECYGGVKPLIGHLLPYKAKNGVNFRVDSISVTAAGKGVIYVDNCYYGIRPDGKDYGLILQFKPLFTNESCAYISFYIKEINTDVLDEFAEKIKEKVNNYFEHQKIK